MEPKTSYEGGKFLDTNQRLVMLFMVSVCLESVRCFPLVFFSHPEFPCLAFVLLENYSNAISL